MLILFHWGSSLLICLLIYFSLYLLIYVKYLVVLKTEYLERLSKNYLLKGTIFTEVNETKLKIGKNMIYNNLIST